MDGDKLSVVCKGESIFIKKSILKSIEGSSLEAMLSGRHSITYIGDRILIDREPSIFQVLLTFLENESFLPYDSGHQTLKCELNFWGIPPNEFRLQRLFKSNLLSIGVTSDVLPFWRKLEPFDY